MQDIKEKISFRIDPGVAALLKSQAERERVTPSTIIRRALLDYLAGRVQK